MSYIKNPGEFYTMLKSDERKKIWIEKRAEDYLAKNDKIPEKAEKGFFFFLICSSEENYLALMNLFFFRRSVSL